MLGLRFTHNCLSSKDAKAMAKFYTEIMGMNLIKEIQTHDKIIKFLAYSQITNVVVDPERGCLQISSHTQPGRQLLNTGRNQVYWKVGVNLSSVDLAVQKLSQRGKMVSAASQFMDIGYLTHLSDPDGFGIELLQTTFEDHFKPIQPKPDLALGQPGTLGMVTIRTNNIKDCLKFYQDTLGMKVLCRENVCDYGFHLYFLAFTDEQPPNSDLDHVDNREWTYQRPYMVLEIQAFVTGSSVQPYTVLTQNDIGFEGLGMMTDNIKQVKTKLQSAGYKISKETIKDLELDGHPSFRCQGPDELPVRIAQF